MATLDSTVITGKGGVSCKYCQYWSKYSEEARQKMCLVGTWGECTQIDNRVQALRNPELFQKESKDRLNTDIEKIEPFGVVLSTTKNYNCKLYEVKKGINYDEF